MAVRRGSFISLRSSIPAPCALISRPPSYRWEPRKPVKSRRFFDAKARNERRTRSPTAREGPCSARIAWHSPSFSRFRSFRAFALRDFHVIRIFRAAPRFEDPQRAGDGGAEEGRGVAHRFFHRHGAGEDARHAFNADAPQVREVFTQPTGEGQGGHVPCPAPSPDARNRLAESGLGVDL